MRKFLSFVLVFTAILESSGQITDSIQILNKELDNIYIAEFEDKKGKPKVLHAEPLYIDLIRDLGARKGEKEWNVGFGMFDNRTNTEYEALVEYEFAPIDRLGLEIEFPFTLYDRRSNESTPSSRLNSLKLAAQWSFLVSEKAKTTLALGYLHEFEFVPFDRYGKDNLYEGNIYNPFFIAAKRWGLNFHTMIYTGPSIHQTFATQENKLVYEMHSNFHYMIPGTRNFIGVEMNKYFTRGDFDLTIRPQMRVGISDNLLIGIVTGIPIKREIEGFSNFIRLIYEPGHRAVLKSKPK